MEIAKSELIEILGHEYEALICFASFDRRWSVIPNLARSAFPELFVIKYLEWEMDAKEVSTDARIIDLSKLKAFDLWKSIATKLIDIIVQSTGKVVIDISGSDNEMLLFIVAQINERKLNNKVDFVYLGAKSYSKRLMSGVRDIRTVLGYPGEFSPSKKFHHLIILLGFELERAKNLIMEYEPSSISIGVGGDSYSGKFLSENKITKSKVEEFLVSLGRVFKEVSEFEFSCSDVLATKEAVLKEAKKFEGSNVLISPMNTKVSTIGAGLAALENEELKVCYVEPLEYDFEDYSEPGETISLFSI